MPEYKIPKMDFNVLFVRTQNTRILKNQQTDIQSFAKRHYPLYEPDIVD